MAHTVTGASLNDIYTKLNGAPEYHPMDANTFADWSMEAGDVITVKRGEEEYQSPVHSSRMVWRGTPQTTISSTGKKEREAVSKVSRKKYGRGGTAVRSQEYIYKEFTSSDGMLHSAIYMSESKLTTQFDNAISDVHSSIVQTAEQIYSEVYSSNSTLYSYIDQTATYIESVVADINNDLGSAILQTASQIRSEVHAANSNLYSYIDQTATYIESVVADINNDLGSAILQTASQIRSEVHAANSNLYSYIDQTATYIESVVSDVTGSLGSAILQTASQIRSEVHAANSNLYSYIDQTATYISAAVENIESSLGSNIVQTADQIYSEVHAANSAVYSHINQTATSISSRVENVNEDLHSEILQTQSMIRSAVWTANSTVYAYVDQTASYILDHVGERSGSKVISSLEEPQDSPDNPLNVGDLWVEGTEINTWDDFPEGEPWIDYDPYARQLGWLDVSGQNIHVWEDGQWKLVEDGRSVVDDTAFLRLKDQVSTIAYNYKMIDGEMRGNIARLDVRADGINSSVKQNSRSIGELGSNLSQTATQIRTEVHAANSKLYSAIEQTATSIRSYVRDEINDVGSEILQTANQIRSEVHAANSTLYSYIDQTATYIQSEVADTANGLNSKITQTASQIRSEVNAANSRIYSSITQTASSIRSEVANAISGVNSSITQTANSIRSEVNASSSTLRSYIDQTATNIRQVVANVESGLESSINVEAGRIDLVVSSGSNPKIKPAAIKTAINGDTSSVFISANQIELSGYVKASDLTTTWLKTKIESADLITAKSLQIYNGTTPYGTANVQNIRALLNSYKIVQDGNNYKLQYKPLNSSAWVDAPDSVTFSRATSLSGAWSSNTYTVTASPQGNTNSVTPVIHHVIPQGTPNATLSTYVATGASGGTGYSDHGDVKNLYLVKDGLTVKLRNVNNNTTASGNYTYAQTTIANSTVSGSWSSNTWTATSTHGGSASVTVHVEPISSQGGTYVDLYVATSKSTSPYYDTHGDVKKLYLVKDNLTVKLRNVNDNTTGTGKYTYAQTTCSDTNFTEGNIKSGVTIFGKTGTYQTGTTLTGSWSSNTYTVSASPQTASKSVTPVIHHVVPSATPTATLTTYVATSVSTGTGYEDHGSAKSLYLVKDGLTVKLRNVNSTSTATGNYTYAQTTIENATVSGTWSSNTWTATSTHGGSASITPKIHVPTGTGTSVTAKIGTTSIVEGETVWTDHGGDKTLYLVKDGRTVYLRNTTGSSGVETYAQTTIAANVVTGTWSSNTWTATGSLGGSAQVTPVIHYVVPSATPTATLTTYVATSISTGTGYSDHGSAKSAYLVQDGDYVKLRNVNSTSTATGNYTYAQLSISASSDYENGWKAGWNAYYNDSSDWISDWESGSDREVYIPRKQGTASGQYDFYNHDPRGKGDGSDATCERWFTYTPGTATTFSFEGMGVVTQISGLPSGTQHSSSTIASYASAFGLTGNYLYFRMKINGAYHVYYGGPG